MAERKNAAPALVDGVTYPGGRVVSYGYGTASSIDDRLHRLAALEEASTQYIGYEYNGTGRMVSAEIGTSGRWPGNAGSCDPGAGMMDSRCREPRLWARNGDSCSHFEIAVRRKARRKVLLKIAFP